ncbi:hypothetical protein M422DRAFT_47734 [Sphaerobolus stellatus SS14]|uniref:Isochorismatase-like domain-containing protein n=1 Tax=Sphaerobolus stellatus (strain SS14) TaxID=990650 RepID=A0A0C9VPC4_SPHS4|nr:hypothetical protein M422DRAFT_47734 [Sphaerobolus stellatus SS14]
MQIPQASYRAIGCSSDLKLSTQTKREDNSCFNFNLSSDKFTYERLDKNNAALLVVDHQVGLFQFVRDLGPEEFRNNILPHAALGKVFDLPTILTTSAETEIVAMHPKAPFIKRGGEVNAWDNKDFRDAVRTTGKKQVIVAGIVTDSTRIAQDANARMLGAGVHVLSGFVIAGGLLKDWRNVPEERMLPFFDE